MKRLLLLVSMLALASCASPGSHANYKGVDAGVMVMSIGWTEPSTDHYLMLYRKVGETGIGPDYVSIHTSSDIFRQIDYTGNDTGSVVTERLEPGTYEFYRVQADQQSGVSHFSKNVFSLRFDIKPGQATYLGSYTATLITKKQHNWLLGRDYDSPGGVTFLVSDKHDRDLEIARKRDPTLPPVALAIPEDGILPKPYFTTSPLE
ncbi:MAG TPA: hypothetical protein VFS01_08100 [Rhizomicrobium sp.]|nr:hypothetical protein [Rhizomicrobium sp.]